jgi:nucleoid DNA-binding protein
MYTTMTKRGLVLRLWKDRDMTQQAIMALVQQAFDCIIEELAKGNTVEFRDFGTFNVRVHKGRIGRNPRIPGTEMRIPTRSIVKFTPGKIMRNRVLKLKPKVARQRK